MMAGDGGYHYGKAAVHPGGAHWTPSRLAKPNLVTAQGRGGVDKAAGDAPFTRYRLQPLIVAYQKWQIVVPSPSPQYLHDDN